MADAEQEKFSVRKLVQGLNPLDPVGWAKASVLTLKSLILVGLVLLALYGYGYWKGYRNRPVQVDMKDAVIHLKNGEGKTHELKAKDGRLYFDGQPVKTSNIKNQSPVGIELHPKAVTGVTSSGNVAAGVGLEVAHAYRFNLDLLALYKFLGAGVSYDIRLEKPVVVDNTSICIGVGRDLETDENAAILYVGIEF